MTKKEILRHYEHFPLEEAERLLKNQKLKRFKVETINWTFATEKGKKKQNYRKV